jgi:Uri superfamily endonuclease
MLSPQKGTYLLVFHLREKLSVETKSGRRFYLPKGVYIYVGSAFGSGGIKARVGRHLKRQKKLHWHIDYITTSEGFEPIGVIPFYGKRWECKLARFLGKFLKTVEGFGSTDCSCKGHLFLLEDSSEG